MKRVRIDIYASVVLMLALLLGACTQVSDALKVKDVKGIEVVFNLSSDSDLPSLSTRADKGLEINLKNLNEQITYSQAVTSSRVVFDDVLPGIYSVTVAGTSVSEEGEELFFNGSLQNQPITTEGITLDIKLYPGKSSPLVFKEIFYSGTANFYFRNQFYELYNNSDEVIYLDGIYFCVVWPGKATSKMPIWPEEDKGKYIYTDRLWRIPGSGQEYPLQPGESCILSQFAANHKLEIYNPDSPVDTSSAEFEFNMNNARFPDQPAYDMEHVFYDGRAEMGRMPQYLTTVFGAAYIIFRVPEGETYDPVNDPSLSTTDLSHFRPTLFAKIPISYVLDGVEAGDNENAVDKKRLPGMIDAGMTWVGDTYNSLGIVRKKIGERPDGTPLLQDTNNSTDDFERGVTPELRRYGAKMPAWNQTLKK